ncbi:MAG: universal stress protein [Nitritalea sp.]
MKTLLVPFDFSETATFALDFAIELAEKSGAALHVLHVVEVPANYTLNTMGGGVDPNASEMEQVYFVELVEKRKKDLADLSAKYQDKSFEFVTKLQLGSPFSGISKEIAEVEADMVIMGSRGSSGLEELLIGSNTEKVVRYAKCPVLTVKGPTQLASLKKIVYASDFSAKKDEVIEQVKELQKTLGAELYLVKVNTPSAFESSRTSFEKIEAFIERHAIQHVTAEIYNSPSEEEGIVDYAQDIDADLIALGTHGRTGFLHLLSGSIAEDVVNSAKRPVWTMKIQK